MGFFSGKSQIKVDGKKQLSNSKAVIEYLEPKSVAIPLKNMGSESFEIHVEIGDKVKIGTKIATRNDHFTVPVFSSVSGVVTAIEKKAHVSLKPTLHIVIENDFKEEKEQLFEGIADASLLEPSQITNYIKDLGVVGLGGSGFPTYIKYSKPEGIHTVLVNGIECEPYITADELSMKNNPTSLFEGVLIAMKAANAKNGIIAIKEGKPKLYELLSQTAKDYDNIEVKQVRDVYPMGWERLLVREVFGRDYDKLPSEIGVIVNNATTLIELANSLKSGLPLYERIVTLSGEGYKNPVNVKVKIGTQLSEIVEVCGGYVDQVPTNSRLIAGGAFMGGCIISDAVSVTSYSNAFTSLVNTEHVADPCLRCGKCIEFCPTGLQPVQIAKAHQAKDYDLLELLAAVKCIECGSCTYICPSSIQVTESTRQAKRFVLAKK